MRTRAGGRQTTTVNLYNSLGESLCPKHYLMLTPGGDGDGGCARCGKFWTFATASGTIPTTPMPGLGDYPSWVVTDGTTVMVSKEPNWGSEQYFGPVPARGSS
jgi:hypothetical protein